jgi:hypothetical protein
VVSLWLNSGVPATGVTRRAAHGVAVLLKIYAHCTDGQADAANERITHALSVPRTPSPSPNAMTREMTTSSRHPKMTGQRHKAGRMVGVTAPTAPVRGFSAPVRSAVAEQGAQCPRTAVSHSIEYSSCTGSCKFSSPGHRAGSISRPRACREILADIYLWTSSEREVI